jgi:hypothetical protein
VRIGVLALLLAAVATACAEAPQQRAAREAVARYAGGGKTRCTSNPILFYTQGPAAKVFVCIVRTHGIRCDRYVARRSGNGYSVVLRRRDVDCTLPIG